jgi:type VI secretion system protein ImpI
MNLILELVARDGQAPNGERRKVFGVTGGRIGRASDCEWVLHSPYISRYHATVCYIEGAFHIVSTSDNGVALNDAFTTLPQLENQALRHGDRLFIDEYEITVSISDATQDALPSAPEAAPAPEPLSLEDELTRESPLLRSAFGLDPLREFTPVPGPSPNTSAEEFAWNHSPGLVDHFAPPPVTPVPAALPADWDQTHLPASAPPRVESPTQETTVPASVRDTGPPPPPVLDASGKFDLSVFLRGAGIDPDSLEPEMAFTLGRMLRASVQGLIEALQTRAEFRDQFRLPVTRVKKSENNPLKFAIDVDDAWSSLLRKRADRYLGALDAVDDAFDDIRAHHLAMIVGMQAGFQSVLDRFNPKNLTQEFDKRSRRGGLWPVPAGSRYWRQYVDLFENLTVGDVEGTFRRLFGEEFAQAYERYLDTAKLKPGKL